MTSVFDEHKAYWAKKSGMPSSLVDWLPPTDGLQILDLGCGGGRLAATFENAVVYGIDCSSELLAEAQRYPHLRLFAGDVQSPEVWKKIGPLDLIVSNCAIRKDYTPNLSDVARHCFDKLRPGGLLLMRIEAVSDLSEVLPRSVRETLFFNKDELLEHLNMFRVECRDEAFRQKFSSVTYLNQFLARIQIQPVAAKNLNPTRRYYVIRAEK